jgi:hypothetical protein
MAGAVHGSTAAPATRSHAVGACCGAVLTSGRSAAAACGNGMRVCRAMRRGILKICTRTAHRVCPVRNFPTASVGAHGVLRRRGIRLVAGPEFRIAWRGILRRSHPGPYHQALDRLRAEHGMHCLQGNAMPRHCCGQQQCAHARRRHVGTKWHRSRRCSNGSGPLRSIARSRATLSGAVTHCAPLLGQLDPVIQSGQGQFTPATPH